MKTLVIIRHAKAKAAEDDKKDIDRKLKLRGKEDAAYMAYLLSEYNIVPELLISSPAKRAVKTAAIFAKKFDISKSDIHVSEFLYETDFGSEEVKNLLSEWAPDKDTVFIFGHNPMLIELISALTEKFNYHLPTSGTVIIEFSIEKWEELAESKGTIKLFVYPEKKEK